MKSFVMKACSVNGEWFEFSLCDLPTMIDKDTFILLKITGSPKLLVKTIRRGDYKTSLYEGDVISMNGIQWLVCYERGFYIINSDYICHHLYELSEHKYLHTVEKDSTIVPINFKTTHLFKIGDLIFRFNDIVGGHENKLIVRASKDLISPIDVQQECSMSINNQKVYLGDSINGSTVELRGGRICLVGDNIIDSCGGILNGRVS